MSQPTLVQPIAGSVGWASAVNNNFAVTEEALRPPAFQAILSAGLTLNTSGTLAVVPFSVVQYDLNSNYNTSSRWFVAPSAGLYHFDVGGLFNPVYAGSIIYFAVCTGTGTPTAKKFIGGSCNAAGNYAAVAGGCDLVLAANERVQIQVTSVSSSAPGLVYDTTWCFFSGHRVAVL